MASMDRPMGVGAPSGPAADGMAGMGPMAASGVSAAGWSFAAAAAFLVAWTAMMAAMMFPAAAPMLLVYHAVSARRRSGRGRVVLTWIFAAGYLLVWTAVGVIVFVVVRLGGAVATRLDGAARVRWAPLALGATLVVAGLYQFTPLKRVCLRQCQSPLGFVAAQWRDGASGALRMGIVHGAYCLGCCWALFAVLVAAGVMSLAWMLLLTLVVFAEKVLPGGTRIAAGVGAAFILLGILVASGAAPLPGTG
jgi:predicted metal-binding membrane protein